MPGKQLILYRVALTKDGTFGVLCGKDEAGEFPPLCTTLERRWENNAKEKSSVPPGNYTVKRTHSPRFGETFEVLGVLNRDNILFHKGNKMEDSLGCILVGSSFEMIAATGGVFVNGISGSTIAFTKFMRYLNGTDQTDLLIRS